MKNYTLYLIRHGITAANLNGLYAGGGTDLPLCPEGREDLEQLKRQFVYPKVDTVFLSPWPGPSRPPRSCSPTRANGW